ncbi:MAG: rRNA maturation RNase YbeY [Clostridiales Family XIII bacterium]|nr:rRNA maturation RNase YbeY [Clostridiales Family XIII bacterium]
MNIVWDGERPPGRRLRNLLFRAGEAVLAQVAVAGDPIEVSVSFVDETEMRALNKRYRGIDRVTDVLSFPQYPDADALRNSIRGLRGARVSMGDIVICPARAAAQARKYGHSSERESLYLFVHSMFHLLGYDHETADRKRRMRTAEKAALAAVGNIAASGAAICAADGNAGKRAAVRTAGDVGPHGPEWKERGRPVQTVGEVADEEE